MTKRERILGAIVGTMAVLFVVGLGAWKFTDALSFRNSQIAALQNDINGDRDVTVRGTRAADDLAEFANSALPQNESDASHMYRTWLLAQLESLGFDKTNLESNQSQKVGDAYVMYQFRASGHGDLEQVTELMYRIEAADILHRVRGFSVTPILDTRLLDFTITTQVVSLDNSLERRLADVSQEKLNGPVLKAYKEKVLGRNLFGPENKPPRLKMPRTIEVSTGERVSITAEADDPDELDSVRYDADLSEVDGAQFNGRELSWSPKSAGEYNVTFNADDNGFPSKRDSQEVRIVVSEPAPPPKREEPPKPAAPGLEKALFAEITAITGSGGRRKIWVSIKSEGRTVRVGEGESFQVGDVDATVVTINNRDAEVVSADKVYRVELGQQLVEASIVRDLTKDGAE
jgi:hypothetical protein